MIYVGIDCGLNGAIVALDGDSRKILSKSPMPVFHNGKRNEIDIAGMNEIFGGWLHLAVTLVIEDPGGHAPSAAGLRSMTYSFAVAKTLAIVNNKPHHTIRATQWQAAFWSRPSGEYDTKSAALKAAKQIWTTEDWRKTPRHRIPFDGYVDAALLAEYGRRKNI